jgi:hypothetical protein
MKKRQNNGQRRKDKTMDNEEKTNQWTKKKRHIESNTGESTR